MTNNYMNPNANAMTPNAMNPAMPADPSAQQFILPEMVDDSFSAEDIGEDFEGIRLSFRKVKIPGGGALQFEIPGDDDGICLQCIGARHYFSEKGGLLVAVCMQIGEHGQAHRLL